MNACCWMAWLLALGAAEAAAQTQAPLKLPSSQGDIRALMRDTGDPICAHCGVVTSIRVLDQPGPGVGSQFSSAPGFGGSIDPGVPSVPFGTERARQERERLREEPDPHYEVTVHFDDGTYGRVEMNHDPRLNRGDRVQVENGSARHYP
jgi:hypothetical protein